MRCYIEQNVCLNNCSERFEIFENVLTNGSSRSDKNTINMLANGKLPSSVTWFL